MSVMRTEAGLGCRQVYVALSAACLLTGITTTYGIGGKYWNTEALSKEAKTAWRFFQPFK